MEYIIGIIVIILALFILVKVVRVAFSIATSLFGLVIVGIILYVLYRLFIN